MPVLQYAYYFTTIDIILIFNINFLIIITFHFLLITVCTSDITNATSIDVVYIVVLHHTLLRTLEN